MFYLASKTLTEKAAWKFVNTHRSEISWDLIVINPPWIFGARLRCSSQVSLRLVRFSNFSHVNFFLAANFLNADLLDFLQRDLRSQQL